MLCPPLLPCLGFGSRPRLQGCLPRKRSRCAPSLTSTIHVCHAFTLQWWSCFVNGGQRAGNGNFGCLPNSGVTQFGGIWAFYQSPSHCFRSSFFCSVRECVHVPSSVSVTLVQACTPAVSIALCTLPVCVCVRQWWQEFLWEGLSADVIVPRQWKRCLRRSAVESSSSFAEPHQHQMKDLVTDWLFETSSLNGAHTSRETSLLKAFHEM